MEHAEARVGGGVRGDRDGLAMLGDPAGDALANGDAEAVKQLGVGVLGGAEDELFSLQNVDQAGIAAHQVGDEAEDVLQDGIERVGSGHAAADLVQKFNVFCVFHSLGQLVHGLRS